MWKAAWIEDNRGKTGEFYGRVNRIVVSIDPAAKSEKTSDMTTGIVVVGTDTDGVGWVLDDRTTKGTPGEWAADAWQAVMDWDAHEVVVEVNQGREIVLDVLNTAWWAMHRQRPTTRLKPRVTPVTATTSKGTRA